MSILPPTLDEINDEIAGETIRPGFVHIDETGAVSFVDGVGGVRSSIESPSAGLVRVVSGDGVSDGQLKAGQVQASGVTIAGTINAENTSITRVPASDADIYINVNNGTRDVFTVKSRDGATLNVGASRYLDVSRDGSQSLRLGNSGGVPCVVTADGLRLLVGARQSTAADYCVGIYNDVEPESSTPLVKFGYGLNGPNTEVARLMASGEFRASKFVSGSAEVGTATVNLVIESDGAVKLVGLPTTDPAVEDQVWQDGTDLKISAG